MRSARAYGIESAFPIVNTSMPHEKNESGQRVTHALVLYDGTCNLCDASVRTILANDPAGRYRFASLDSQSATDALHSFGYTRASFDSIVLVDQSGLWTHSEAALRIACYLRFPWPMLGFFFAVPRRIRDRAYAWIAANRYRVFGRRDACRIPSPDVAERFL